MFLFRLSRALLLMAMAVFLWLGLYALIRPAQVLDSVEIKIETVDARAEVRATYGGMQLALALVFLVTSQNRKLYLGGVALLAVLTTGLLSSRVLSYLIDGPPGKFTLFLAGIELALFIPTTFVLLIQSHSWGDGN